MKSLGNYPIKGAAQVDEIVFGGQEEGVRGRENDKKNLWSCVREKKEFLVFTPV